MQGKEQRGFEFVIEDWRNAFNIEWESFYKAFDTQAHFQADYMIIPLTYLSQVSRIENFHKLSSFINILSLVSSPII